VTQEFLEHVQLSALTTFAIGGPARYFIEAKSEAALVEAIHRAREKDLPVFILGGGSNLLVSDAGFAGLVIKVAILGIEWDQDRDRTFVRAGAGEDWDHLVRLCVDRDLGGVECLSGIPGSVGGTPVQNVGAYGQDVSDVVVSLRAYDREADSLVELTRADCRFAYRTSLFNTTAKNRYVVSSVTYALAAHAEPAVRYPDVKRAFEGRSAPPTLPEVRSAVREIRAGKAMLLTPGDPDCRSAGSFFKNPILDEQQFRSLQTAAGDGVPRYPAAPGKVKTAAAWLIEHAGFSKGYCDGAVGLSSKHTLAVVNRGGGTAADVLKLAREIRTRVKDRFGVTLEPEPVFVGFDEDVVSEFFG
jgi:UDP-N-acetylmuramate dehydrogenase